MILFVFFVELAGALTRKVRAKVITDDQARECFADVGPGLAEGMFIDPLPPALAVMSEGARSPT